MGQVAEALGAVVLHGQVRERATGDRGQGDVDAGDARFIQGVLDQLPDQPALAMLLGLLAESGSVHVEPLLAHWKLLCSCK